MNYTDPTSFYNPFQDSLQRQTERRALLSAAGFVGVLMLLLTITMQLTYPLLVLLLSFWGALPPNALALNELGVGNTAFLCIYACVYALAMGLPLFLALFRRRLFAARYPKQPLRGNRVFFSILTAVGGCMAANVITNIVLSFLENWDIPIPEMPDMMENTPTSLLLNFFVIAVLPAILEEAVFRGCVLRVLRPFGDGFAVCVSAVLFGLMHGNIRQVPFAIIVGLILGKLYVSTNSIVYPMVVHFINNALSVWMEYWSLGMSDNAMSTFYGGIIYALSIIGAFTGILLLISHGKRSQPNSAVCSLQSGEKVSTLLRSPAFVIATLIFIALIGLELMA